MEDLRVLKTRSTIENAFAELILEKGLDAVKIIDVTTRAKIDRHTFYRHYKNKQDLRNKMVTDFFDDFVALIDAQDSLKAGYRSSSDIADFINDDLANFIFDRQMVLRVVQTELAITYKTIFKGKIMSAMWRKISADAPEIEVYVMIGIFASVVQFIIENHTTPSKEQLVQTSQDINTYLALY